MSQADDNEHYIAYEVFIQKTHGDEHVRVGSVLAPSPAMALQLARDNFLRRDAAVSIWIVRQSDIHQTSYEDNRFFVHEFDKSYRDVRGYADNARRWKSFKQQALSSEDM